MAGKKGNSLLETRRRNRVLIKNMIFRMENARRTAIAEELGLTLPTITTSVNEMLSEGILEEIPITDGKLVNNMGRRPNAIAFRAEAAYAIGVELGPYATRAVLMNLRGEVLEQSEYESPAENYAGMLEKITNIINEMVDKAKGRNLLGVGVGLPGFIDREKGEIVRMYDDHVDQLRKPNEDMQICSFLWVYYGFPTSCYEGKNVEEVRFTSGLKMGQTDESEVDCACGIPDSGVGMALGYAEGKGVPYHRAISKYTPTWPRSFTPSNQEMRSLVAKMKLIPNRAMLQNKRLLFCDDSIVRGTQLRDNVKILYDYGAKEVHMRIACPPLIYACPFVGFSASKNALELITRRIIKELEGDENKNLEKYATTGSPEYDKMVSIIAERFGLSSLKFNTLETLIEAIGLPKCKVCTHCFDGSSHF